MMEAEVLKTTGEVEDLNDDLVEWKKSNRLPLGGSKGCISKKFFEKRVDYLFFFISEEARQWSVKEGRRKSSWGEKNRRSFEFVYTQAISLDA